MVSEPIDIWERNAQQILDFAASGPPQSALVDFAERIIVLVARVREQDADLASNATQIAALSAMVGRLERNVADQQGRALGAEAELATCRGVVARAEREREYVLAVLEAERAEK